MPADDRIDIRLPTAEKERFTQAATAEPTPLSLSLWLRMLANKRADKVLGRGKAKR